MAGPTFKKLDQARDRAVVMTAFWKIRCRGELIISGVVLGSVPKRVTSQKRNIAQAEDPLMVPYGMKVRYCNGEFVVLNCREFPSESLDDR